MMVIDSMSTQQLLGLMSLCVKGVGTTMKHCIM